MSQQINLYDPALLRKRELLTAASLAATALLLLTAMGAWGGLVRAQLATIEGESLSLAPLVKGLQDQLVVVGRQLADIKPDPRLAADLSAAREMLGLRRDVVAALKKGTGSDSVSFAEYLRGFARQTPNGLWLTAFAIADGGAAMEIRGRMTDPALLPEYITRLNGEKAFKGRAFAALKISAGTAESQAQAPNAPVVAVPAAAAAAPAPFHEFTLIPAAVAARRSGDLLPPDAGRAPEGKR